MAASANMGQSASIPVTSGEYAVPVGYPNTVGYLMRHPVEYPNTVGYPEVYTADDILLHPTKHLAKRSPITPLDLIGKMIKKIAITDLKFEFSGLNVNRHVRDGSMLWKIPDHNIIVGEIS